MITVSFLEAKIHLAKLLEQVSAGEQILITTHGKVVARLVPVDDQAAGSVRHAIDGLKGLRERLSFGDEDWKDLRDIGRR